MTFYIKPYRRLGRNQMVAHYNLDNARYLPVNVFEEEDTFVITAQVPGLKSEDVDIQVLENVVHIEGEYHANETEYLLKELPSGPFRRTLRMPSEVEADKIEAKIIDGVLTLHLPKAESAKPKKIKVLVK
ncbi:MAG: Hsp20/alpha crystallin family protein [Anaerolineales bacterium]|nr:Hsp20/alpha crystallin family protein [Anaerolineales bacterium]